MKNLFARVRFGIGRNSNKPKLDFYMSKMKPNIMV